MKTNRFTLAALILVLGIVAIIVTRSDRPSKEAPQIKLGNMSAAGMREYAEAAPRPATASNMVKVVELPADHPLNSALKCAQYIAEVQASLPRERGTARHQLQGLTATLFINDYIMAAKARKDGSLDLSAEAIAQAYTNVAPNVAVIRTNLASYSSFPETLEEHYSRVKRGSGAEKQIAAIEQTMRESGIEIDPNSDLMLDCLRLVCFNTEIESVYGPKQSPTDDTSANPAEAKACRESFAKVFYYRFTNRFRLQESVAEKLSHGLATLSVTGLSPADLEVPVVLR